MSTSLRDAYLRDAPEACAVDTETTGLAFYDTPFLASFAWDRYSGYVDLGSEEGREDCSLLLSRTPALIFHNAKFDLQKLRLAGLCPGVLPHVHDTECLAHLLDEHRPKGLKPLARSVLGLETDEADAISKARRKYKLTKADGLDKLYEVEPELVASYAVKDAEFTWALFQALWPEVQRYEDLVSLYELEQELQMVLLDMEEAGMAVDLPYVQETSKEYAGRIVRAEWAMEDATGLKVFHPAKPSQKTPEGHINPASTDQLQAYFASKGVETDSVNKDFLKESDDPLAAALLEARAAKKKNDYLVAMLREQRGGILHPHFRQHGTRGRRMSSGEAEG